MDFYDKLFTSIVCVILTLFCLFNVFVFADTEISGTIGHGLYIDFPSKELVNRSGCTYIYFELIPGHTYKVTSNSSFVVSKGFLSEPPVLGSSVDSPKYFYTGQSDTFVATSDYLFLISTTSNSTIDISLLDITPLGFESAVNDLVQNVGINNIWNTFEISLPYVVVVVLAGFGFYLIFHNIKEISNGKEKM